MAGIEAVFVHSCRSVQFGVFLEPDTQGPLGFTYISMFRIIVAGDVVYGATLSLLRGLILGMDKHGPHGIGRLVIHVNTVGFKYPRQDLGCALHQTSAVGVLFIVLLHCVRF